MSGTKRFGMLTALWNRPSWKWSRPKEGSCSISACCTAVHRVHTQRQHRRQRGTQRSSCTAWMDQITHQRAYGVLRADTDVTHRHASRLVSHRLTPLLASTTTAASLDPASHLDNMSSERYEYGEQQDEPSEVERARVPEAEAAGAGQLAGFPAGTSAKDRQMVVVAIRGGS